MSSTSCFCVGLPVSSLPCHVPSRGGGGGQWVPIAHTQGQRTGVVDVLLHYSGHEVGGSHFNTFVLLLKQYKSYKYKYSDVLHRLCLSLSFLFFFLSSPFCPFLSFSLFCLSFPYRPEAHTHTHRAHTTPQATYLLFSINTLHRKSDGQSEGNATVCTTGTRTSSSLFLKMATEPPSSTLGKSGNLPVASLVGGGGNV